MPVNFSIRLSLAVALASFAALLLPAAGQAASGVLYETVGGNPATTPSTSLYRVDPSSGATTVVGDTGQKFTGLAVDPTDGQLYGVTNQQSANPRALYKINSATGGVQIVGPLGLSNPVADIDFDIGGNLYGWSEDTDRLARINKETGVATEYGPGNGSNGDGMSFDKNGTLYAALDSDNGPLWIVNTDTGGTTAGPTLSGTDGYSVSAASFDCTGTTLYATIPNGGSPPSNLVTINQTSGLITTLGPTQLSADGLVWYCPTDISTNAVTAKAADGKVTIPISADGATKGPVSVTYSTSDGSAKAGSDYTAVGGTKVFAPFVQNATATVDVNLAGDPKVGEERTFNLDLGNATGTGKVVNQQATVTITPFQPILKVQKKKGGKKKPPKFKLISNQKGSTFKCKVDKKPFKKCTSPFKAPKKGKAGKKGKHTLKVRAINKAGLSSKTVRKNYRIKGKKK